jgi:hydrogenase maturation factor
LIIKDRLLFLKYALPCAGTLVKRGNTTKEHVEGLVKLVSDGKVPAEDAESMFKVANAMCDSIGRRMGKETVDSDVIRQYFLLEHSEVVDDRYKLMGDFDPVDCKTYLGKVSQVDGDSAIVETKLGKKKYRSAFVNGLKAGDSVIVHWNFVVERAPGEFAKRMDSGG